MLGTGKRSSETKCGILLPLFLIWLIKIPDQVYTCFQTRTAQKTLPFGAAHTHMAYIRKYPPTPYPGQILSLEILKALVTLEQVNTSVVKKKKNLKDQNLYRETGMVS